MSPTRIFLIHGPDDRAVLVNGVLILADDSTARNEIYPAHRVAKNIAEALRVPVDERDFPEHILATEDWIYEDLERWAQEQMAQNHRREELKGEYPCR